MRSVAKLQKTQRWDSLGTLKNFRKKSHSAEKIKRGDPLVSVGFVGYVKKVKNERGDTLETKKIRNSRTVPKNVKEGTLFDL